MEIVFTLISAGDILSFSRLLLRYPFSRAGSRFWRCCTLRGHSRTGEVFFYGTVKPWSSDAQRMTNCCRPRKICPRSMMDQCLTRADCVQDVWSSFAALGSYVHSACASSTFARQWKPVCSSSKSSVSAPNQRRLLNRWVPIRSSAGRPKIEHQKLLQAVRIGANWDFREPPMCCLLCLCLGPDFIEECGSMLTWILWKKLRG